MNEALAYITGYGVPIVGLLVALVAMVLAIGVALAWPRYIVLGYVAILMLFPMTSSYGLVDASDANIMYVKGTKTFFFSFLDMIVFGTWLMAVLYSRIYARSRDTLGPLMKFYLAFGALFLGHVLVGLANPSHPSLLDFYGRGVINILWQGMLVALLLTVIRTENDLHQLVMVMLLCIAGRELFGMVRYVFLGGDPQNAYANLQNLKVKITFWDINDAILAAFALAYCSWKLLAERVQANWTRVGYAVFAVMAAMVVMLSARRTAQVGLLLAVAVLAWLLPRGRRLPVVLTLALLAPMAAIVTAARTEGPASLAEKVLIDVKTDNMADPRKSRFYELETAWRTISKSPMFGVGPSGSFTVDNHFGLEYHKGNYDFVHSGFGHVLLKTGFLGLALFVGLFVSYLRFVAVHWRNLESERRALVVAALAAFAAQMPNMLFGTPIGEIRTMMVLGLIFAIPFLTIALTRQQASVTSSSQEKPNDAKQAPAVVAG